MSLSMDRTASCTPGFEDLQMLTTADVAMLLALSEKSVRQMVARHELEAHRFPKGYRFSRSAIIEMLQRTRTGPAPTGKPSRTGRFNQSGTPRRPTGPVPRASAREDRKRSGAGCERGAHVSKKGTLTALVREES